MEMTKEQIETMTGSIVEKALAKLTLPVNRIPLGDEGDGKRTDLQPTGFKSFGEWLRAVNDVHAHKMSAGDWRMKALSEGTDSAGGFFVPQQWAALIEAAALESAIVRPLARKQPMMTDTLNYPTVSDTAHSSSVHGGIIAYWTEEAGTKTPSQPKFGALKLIAKKLIGFTYASDELLEDAPALEALLIKLFGDGITWFEEEAFWQGNGVGQPLGIINSSALVTPFRATASQIALIDIGTLMSRFQGDLYGKSTVFVGNKAILPYLINLGSTIITWTGIAGQRVPTGLMGIPLHFTEHVATLGSVGDLGLYDLDQYVIGDRKGLKIDRSIEYRFSTDETTWRFVKRVDGQPLTDSAFTPKRGSTQSPYVCLASTTQ